MVSSLLLAFLGGILMWLSQPPRRLAPLQIPALALFLWGLQFAQSPSQVTACALIFALSQTLLTLFQLRLHPLLGAILTFSQSALWLLFAFWSAPFLQSPTLASAFFVASAGAFLTWLEWTLLPMWGTTQAWSRPWSLFPGACRFVALAGVSALPFALLFGASSLVLARQNAVFGLWLGAFLPFLGAINWVWGREKAVQKIKIATFGWASGDFQTVSELESAVQSAIAEAGRNRAKLLVLPEAAFSISDRAAFREKFGALARKNQIALAVGYFDETQNRNCIDFLDARGEPLARYVKTHLVPFFENYTRGKGELAQVPIEGVQIGGLICQDDNFSDIAARYGLAKTQLLAIPTQDWRAVKDFHFAGALWRALEFRIALAVAASSGLSFLCDGKGRVVASCDHFQSGPKLLVGEIEILCPQTTLAARYPNAFPLLCAVLALLGLFFQLR